MPDSLDVDVPPWPPPPGLEWRVDLGPAARKIAEVVATPAFADDPPPMTRNDPGPQLAPWPGFIAIAFFLIAWLMAARYGAHARRRPTNVR